MELKLICPENGRAFLGQIQYRAPRIAGAHPYRRIVLRELVGRYYDKGMYMARNISEKASPLEELHTPPKTDF